MTVALGVAVLLLAAGTLCKAQPQPPLVCPESTGDGLCAEFCSADTPCPDGQLCCSNGCGHSCMPGVPPAVNCSDPEQEGVQFNPTPCTFCTCEQGNKICAVVDCAYPDCDGGLKPVVFPGDCCPKCPQTTCPNTTGMLGTCVESCSDDSVCEDDRLCCSNGCGHVCTAPYVNCSGVPDGYTHQRTPCETCTCSGGERRCDLIICDWPVCPNGVSPVTAPGECCPGCPTSSCTEGGNSYASGMSWTCSDGCNTCRCDDGMVAMTEIGCPPTCTDATGVHPSGDSWTCPDGCNTCTCHNGMVAKTDRACTPCTYGDNSYASGISWTCSDGCNTCSCRNGTVLSTLIACPPLRPCTDATGVHPSSDSWTCPDGCNTCTCFNGTVGSTRIACAPCTDGDTNAVHQSGESWRCRDGCPTCTCRHGSVVVNATGCPSNCTNGDGDIIPEGSYWQLNNDPCTTCFCMEGREACIAIACALPYCGPGVQPVSVAGQCCPVCPTPQRPPHIACPDLSNLTTTCDLGCGSDEACEGSQICCSGGCSSVCVEPVLLTCPDASGKVGTCVESCSNSSQCQIGQLCCSNGCGHECFIADKLNCSLVECPAVRCSYGTPFTPEGECCPQCPVDCRAVFCAQPDCEDYEEEVIPKGGCCPVCRCKPSLCPVPLCLHGLPFTPEGECCQECPADCSSVDCAEVDCEYGRPFTPKGECCPVCPPEEKLCEEYGEELDVTDMDPCLQCDCNAEFVYECRRVTSGDDCEAVSCQLDDMLYRSGSVFTDGCSRCECTNGVVKCAEMGCSAADGSGVRLEMGFAGNYDDYNDVTEQEELIKVLKKQLSSKFRHLRFMDSQVKDVKVHQGSVYLTFTIVAVEGGADPSTMAKTLETEHRTGTLVLVANNQTLVPLASTFSLTYVAAGSDMQDGSNVAAIVVPVVVGVVVIVAIIAAAIVILYAIKTARGQSAGGKANYRDGVCTIQNEYMMVDEKVKWDSSSIDSDKEVKV